MLANLGLSVEGDTTVIEVRNKSDLLDQASREFHINSANRSNNRVVLLSAASGEGVDQLSFSLGQVLCADWKTLEIDIPGATAKHSHGFIRMVRLLTVTIVRRVSILLSAAPERR